MIRGREITWRETGKTFVSLKEASAELGFSYHAAYSSLSRKGFYCPQKGVTLFWDLYIPKEGEKFRWIPGFEGKYRISNLKNVYSETGGRLLRPANTKHGIEVVLYLEGIPKPISLNKIFNEVWSELATPTVPANMKKNDNYKYAMKFVRCSTDNIDFQSYIDCCRSYKFDYQEFRKAVKCAEDGKFTYKGKDFELAC